MYIGLDDPPSLKLTSANTFYDKVIKQNIENAIPQAMAEMNRRDFSGESDDDEFWVQVRPTGKKPIP